MKRNTLSEEEVLKHVQGKLELPPSKEYLREEVDNILRESNRMLERIEAAESLVLSVERIKEINRIVLNGLALDEGVIAGEIRTYSVGVMTYRGEILLAAGVPSPASHLLSNHYNLTRNEYLAQLKDASTVDAAC